MALLRKSKKASVVLNPFVSLLGHFITRGSKKSGNRRTDRPSTVTLPAQARRGLIMPLVPSWLSAEVGGEEEGAWFTGGTDEAADEDSSDTPANTKVTHHSPHHLNGKQ